MKNTFQAFSLIELLVTLAIIAILAAISWPLYQDHLIKVRRTQAKVALMQLAAQLEHYALLHHTYQGTTLNHLGVNAMPAQGYYELRIVVASDNQFQISAIPQKTQIHDTVCGTLMLSEAGQKYFSGTGDLKECG